MIDADIYKDVEFLTTKEVQNFLKVSKSFIYDKINPMSPRYDETFPLGIKIGQSNNCKVLYIKKELIEWIESKW